MTSLTQTAYGPGRLARLGRLLLDSTIGALLCTGPVTAVIALGWLARRSGHLAREKFGIVEEAPGWILGPRESKGQATGRMVRALGGLGANIRAGLIALTALLVWTLPFTLLWLGAWWAGWENSFNKGYEQAFVGPWVYMLGAVAACAVLPMLPLMFAHLATEDRLSAAFELRRLRSVVAQSGWRLAGLGILTTLCALPLVAARGVIATATDTWPVLEEMSPDQIADIQGQVALALGAFAFLSTWLLRSLAARIYARAAARAATRRPGLWDASQASEGVEAVPASGRSFALVWYGLAMVVMLGFSFLLLVGQFLDHAWWRWIFHPALTLPWSG